MKLSGAQAARFIARPEPGRPGLLLHGADAMRVSLKRAEAVKGIAGPNGEEDMRVSRIAGSDLRRTPALLLDAIRERGFFPGPRVVVVEDASDAAADAIKAALSDWSPEDAQVVVTAGVLKTASSLRKLFEGHPTAVSVGVYDDPPDRAEVERLLAAAGLTNVDRDAFGDVMALAEALDPGDFRNTVEKLALYSLGKTGPVVSEDVAAIAPALVEAEVDDVVAAVAEGRAAELCVLIRRLGPKTDIGRVAQLANQHFRLLLSLKSDPAGPEGAVGKLRPAVFGQRRDRMLRQVRICGTDAITAAIGTLTETELSLRSSSQAPEFALVERSLVRIAHRIRDEADKAARRR